MNDFNFLSRLEAPKQPKKVLADRIEELIQANIKLAQCLRRQLFKHGQKCDCDFCKDAKGVLASSRLRQEYQATDEPCEGRR